MRVDVKFDVKLGNNGFVAPADRLFSFDDAAPEIPLASAPLKRVLCQISFPLTPELVSAECEAKVAQLLVERYPLREEVRGMALASLAQQPTTEVLRIFKSLDDSWQVTLAQNFVAVETSSYDSRRDFVRRVREVVDAVSEVRPPPVSVRIGVRYTDQTDRPSPQEFDDWLNPALTGVIGSLKAEGVQLAEQSVQFVLANPESQATVKARSMVLPSNIQFDPEISPEPKETWVLDLDSVTAKKDVWDANSICSWVEQLAENAYKVFYWVVTPEFRTKFGGTTEVNDV